MAKRLARRVFGRQYVIQWDAGVGRYHVTLGNESIGFHKTREGAEALALSHAHVCMPGASPPFAVTFQGAD